MDEAEAQRIANEICAANALTYIQPAGRGAFKSVFHVQGTAGESYALKIIRSNSATALPRTIREIEALNRCSHPNIAQLYNADTYKDGSAAYIYTLEDYLDGGTLGDKVLSENGLDASTVRHIGAQLVDALTHLIPLKLVHRDIKPENIMFRNGCNDPILVDFGIVRDIDATSLTQTFIGAGPGTPFYASPEQLNNQKSMINWRSDQFGLGITLCYAHLQLHPFQYPGEPLNSSETIIRVQTRGQCNAEIIRTLNTSGLGCIERMISVWPVHRYQSPVELVAAWRGGSI